VVNATATTPEGTSVSPTGRTLWESARRPALVVAFVLLAALFIAWATSGDRTGRLDPDSVSASGSRAVAQLLRAQGVEVVRAEGVAAATQAGPGDTLLLSAPDLLTVEQANALASTGADLVVVGTGRPDIVEAFARDLSPLPGGPPRDREPACDLPAALRAGSAETGTVAYQVGADALDIVACYPVGGDPTVVEARTDGHRVLFLGSSWPLENDRLTAAGNASLALGLLGENSRVVWHVPSLTDLPVAPRATFWQLVPPWLKTALVQVGIAVALLALWRGRRLGPVVAEPLPVVVRAAEATEGRGRMYQRARARDRAAGLLRGAARNRLAPRVGLSRTAEPGALVAAVATRVGRPEIDVHALLLGGVPADDRSLVALADDLDALEGQVSAAAGRAARIR
jgi:Domain of unknown function (DUF4350)